MANELAKKARRKKRECLIFKVDFETTYDSICWNFLFCMLRRMGFSGWWISWIRGGIKSNTIFVLVNGSLTQEFYTQRGLWQGDLIAPFLFLIIVEGLSGLM